MKHVVDVIKIGGNVVDSPEALGSFLQQLVDYPRPVILVHGGGKEATRLSEALGVATKFINGRRVTTEETVPIITMVYAGLINKRIVSNLQAMSCRAIGLSGADASVVTATRRLPDPIDFGYVGDIDPSNVDVKFIFSLIDSGIIPVFCAVMSDGKGQLLNCNADSVAAAIALACAEVAEVNLIYCFELPGVLSDSKDLDSLIPHITPESFIKLKESEVITGGMIPKIENAIKAVKNGVKSVVITSAKTVSSGSGTSIHL